MGQETKKSPARRLPIASYIYGIEKAVYLLPRSTIRVSWHRLKDIVEGILFIQYSYFAILATRLYSCISIYLLLDYISCTAYLQLFFDLLIA